MAGAARISVVEGSLHDEDEDEPLEAAEVLLPRQGYLLLRDRKAHRLFYELTPRTLDNMRALAPWNQPVGQRNRPAMLNGFEILDLETENGSPCNIYSKSVTRKQLISRLVTAYGLRPDVDRGSMEYLYSLSKRELCEDAHRIMTENYYDLVGEIEAWRDNSNLSPTRQLLAISKTLGVPRPLDLVVDATGRSSVVVADAARLQRSKTRFVNALLAAAKQFEPRGFEAIKQRASHAVSWATAGWVESLANPEFPKPLQRSRPSAYARFEPETVKQPVKKPIKRPVRGILNSSRS